MKTVVGGYALYLAGAITALLGLYVWAKNRPHDDDAE
jgi:hypothetical protein